MSNNVDEPRNGITTLPGTTGRKQSPGQHGLVDTSMGGGGEGESLISFARSSNYIFRFTGVYKQRCTPGAFKIFYQKCQYLSSAANLLPRQTQGGKTER